MLQGRRPRLRPTARAWRSRPAARLADSKRQRSNRLHHLQGSEKAERIRECEQPEGVDQAVQGHLAFLQGREAYSESATTVTEGALLGGGLVVAAMGVEGFMSAIALGGEPAQVMVCFHFS